MVMPMVLAIAIKMVVHCAGKVEPLNLIHLVILVILVTGKMTVILVISLAEGGARLHVILVILLGREKGGKERHLGNPGHFGPFAPRARLPFGLQVSAIRVWV